MFQHVMDKKKALTSSISILNTEKEREVDRPPNFGTLGNKVGLSQYL